MPKASVDVKPDVKPEVKVEERITPVVNNEERQEERQEKEVIEDRIERALAGDIRSDDIKMAEGMIEGLSKKGAIPLILFGRYDKIWDKTSRLDTLYGRDKDYVKNAGEKIEALKEKPEILIKNINRDSFDFGKMAHLLNTIRSYEVSRVLNDEKYESAIAKDYAKLMCDVCGRVGKPGVIDEFLMSDINGTLQRPVRKNYKDVSEDFFHTDLWVDGVNDIVSSSLSTLKDCVINLDFLITCREFGFNSVKAFLEKNYKILENGDDTGIGNREYNEVFTIDDDKIHWNFADGSKVDIMDPELDMRGIVIKELNDSFRDYSQAWMKDVVIPYVKEEKSKKN